MISNSEIRAKAREILGGSQLFTASWLYPVLVVLIVSAINGVLVGTYVGPIIVTGILSVISTKYFIGRVRGTLEPNQLERTLDTVKQNFLGSMLTGILHYLFVCIGSIVFFIPGIIFSCSFSMAFFIINDHPEMNAMEALKESNRIMKGHKADYFMLNLSFIGWLILGSLCFGIGTLWATAYMSTANAVFYNELTRGEAKEDQSDSTSW